MGQETLFHAFFTLYFFIFTVYRSYYMGFVDASGEEVQKLQEGLAMRRIRYTLGTPVVIGAFAYVLNPAWMAELEMDENSCFETCNFGSTRRYFPPSFSSEKTSDIKLSISGTSWAIPKVNI